MITLQQHIANGVKDKIEHYNCELPTYKGKGLDLNLSTRH
jgi:hypothetical protein